MGMAASQVRLLQLTNRNNSVHRQLMSLSLSKMDLTRDMQNVTKEYQSAISAKTLKWSNNGGVTKIDMSYANLMRPGSLNGSKPYIITDNHDKVVIDQKYLDYAKMISEDGTPGNWSEARTDVISSLTGIDAEKIKNSEGIKEAVNDNNKVLQELKAKEPLALKLEKDSTSELLGHLSSDDLKTKYESGAKIANTSVVSTITQLMTLSKYFGANEQKFKDACNNAIKAHANNATEKEWTVQEIIDLVAGNYSGAVSTSADANGKERYNLIWFDVDSADYKKWQSEYAAWETQYKTAQADYDNSLNNSNMLLTAAEESEIAFYDNLFSTIAEKGWTCNERVSDTNYLTQMLMNGTYAITRTTRTKSESETEPGVYNYTNKYETDIATNCKNVIQVSDTDAKDLALIKYEHEKAIINSKESAIDTKMKNLETEQSAIKQMMESTKNVIKSNIDKNLNVFG